MEIKSVQKSKPGYPTLEQFAGYNDLLAGNVPTRWTQNAIVHGALLAFLLAGISEKSDTKAQAPTHVTRGDSLSTSKDNPVVKRITAGKVAPVFVHGDGSGAIGCIIMGAPVFLSEAEAQKVIVEEFEKANLHFKTKKCPTIYFNARIPLAEREEYYSFNNNLIDLKMDGYCPEFNMVFEYVSNKDLSRFESGGDASTVHEYSTYRAAKVVQKELQRNGRYNAAVFYDPMIWHSSHENTEGGFYAPENQAKNKKLAIEQLILQVDDFIKWVRDEGLVK